LSEKGGRHLHKIDPRRTHAAANPTRAPMTPPPSAITKVVAFNARSDDGFAPRVRGRYILGASPAGTRIDVL